MSNNVEISLKDLDDLVQAYNRLRSLVGPVMCKSEGISREMFEEYLRIIALGAGPAAFLDGRINNVKKATTLTIVQAA
jgi:hypothetical protein